MSEKGVDRTMTATVSRVAVLEYMVAQLFNMNYLANGLSMEQVKVEHSKVAKLFQNQTFAGMDATSSDLMAQEMEESMSSLLEMIEQTFERYSRIQRPSPAN